MKSRGIDSQTRWALVRGPKALPVVFATHQDALENCDSDEYPVRVHIHPTSVKHASAALRREWEFS